MEIIRVIQDGLHRLSVKGTKEIVRDIINVRTNGEYGIATDTPPHIEVISEGLEHKHSIVLLPWEDGLGKQVSDFAEFTATFRNLAGCKADGCDFKVVISEKALY